MLNELIVPLFCLFGRVARPLEISIVSQVPMESKFLLHLPSHINSISTSSKDVINLFKSQIGSLWIQKENDRHKSQIGCHEDEVGFPLEAIDEDGCDHDLLFVS
jgi:hypothetical protein